MLAPVLEAKEECGDRPGRCRSMLPTDLCASGPRGGGGAACVRCAAVRVRVSLGPLALSETSPVP